MIKKLFSFGSALVLSMSSLFVLVAPHAFAAAKTWTGATSANFNVAGNWSPSGVPTTGDVLTFDTAQTSRFTLNNDLTAGTSFGGINFVGQFSDGTFAISGNSLTLTGGISIANDNYADIANDLTITGAQAITTTGASSVALDGAVTAAGTLTKAGTGQLVLSGNNTGLTGAVVVNQGELYAQGVSSLGTTGGGTTVNDGANLLLESCANNATINEPLTLTGASPTPTGDLPTAKLTVTPALCTTDFPTESEQYGAITDNSKNLTLSGAITLGSAVTFAGLTQTTMTGAISGNYPINLVPGYGGKLVVNSSANTSGTTNGTYTPAAFTKTLSDSQPSSSVRVSGTAEITITGARGAVVVDGGKLKGTGTVGALSLSGTGTVAPGMSPGVLNTGSLTLSGGTLEEEIGGTAVGQFDQLNVTGTVALGTATTLSTSLVNSFKPVAGNSFVIINNDSTDAVTGTFSGLAEGATFTLGGSVFKISYVGGTGNDVVLTVQGVPSTPNTGLHLLTSNPTVTLAATLLAAGGAMTAFKRSRRFASKRV
jgi:fibronectin-binding autotransporter adhesin